MTLSNCTRTKGHDRLSVTTQGLSDCLNLKSSDELMRGSPANKIDLNTRMEVPLGKKTLSEDDHAIFVARDFDPSAYVNEAVKTGKIHEAKGRAEHTLRTVDEQISCEVRVLSSFLSINSYQLLQKQFSFLPHPLHTAVSPPTGRCSRKRSFFSSILTARPR